MFIETVGIYCMAPEFLVQLDERWLHILAVHLFYL
jgi:hypothetical protein